VVTDSRLPLVEDIYDEFSEDLLLAFMVGEVEHSEVLDLPCLGFFV